VGTFCRGACSLDVAVRLAAATEQLFALSVSELSVIMTTFTDGTGYVAIAHVSRSTLQFNDFPALPVAPHVASGGSTVTSVLRTMSVELLGEVVVSFGVGRTAADVTMSMSNAAARVNIVTR
jgi:hypothetical protein